MISLGGERREASENERQVEGLCSVKNTFASSLRTVSGSLKEGKSSMLIWNGEVNSEAMGFLIPEDGSKGL